VSKRASVASNNIQEKPRRANDWYATPRKAVEPLIRHLPEYGTFCEPCAGDGALAKHIDDLTEGGVWPKVLLDIEPKSPSIAEWDALKLTDQDVLGCDYIITNPPFLWSILKPMLDLFPTLKPTWLLLPFGYAANKRMAPYMKICKKVQPIGRVKWIEDSKQSSTDDFAWYLFDSDFVGTTKLYARE
jgi:hypothetical protein